jgi:hypothetical protein
MRVTTLTIHIYEIDDEPPQVTVDVCRIDAPPSPANVVAAIGKLGHMLWEMTAT